MTVAFNPIPTPSAYAPYSPVITAAAILAKPTSERPFLPGSDVDVLAEINARLALLKDGLNGLPAPVDLTSVNSSISALQTAVAALGGSAGAVNALRRKGEPTSVPGGTTGPNLAVTDLTTWDKSSPTFVTVSGANPYTVAIGTTGGQSIAKAFNAVPVSGTTYQVAVTLKGAVGGEVVFVGVSPTGTAYGILAGTDRTLTTTDQTFTITFVKAADGVPNCQVVLGNIAANKTFIVSAVSVYAVSAVAVSTQVDLLPAGFQLRSGATTVTGNQIGMSAVAVLDVLNAANVLMARIVARPGELLEYVQHSPAIPVDVSFAASANYLKKFPRPMTFTTAADSGGATAVYSIKPKNGSAFVTVTDPFSVDTQDLLKVAATGVSTDFCTLLS